MPDSSMKRGATLCLALAIGPGSTLADDSLGHRDNISTGLNQRQKAEMKVPPGFVEGSTLNGFIRNYYFARDNHDTPSRRDQREWAQGLMLSFRSGYTDTPIGIGLDAHAFYGLRLDGGGWQRRRRRAAAGLRRSPRRQLLGGRRGPQAARPGQPAEDRRPVAGEPGDRQRRQSHGAAELPWRDPEELPFPRARTGRRLRRSHPPAQPERPQSSHQRLRQRHQGRYRRRSRKPAHRLAGRQLQRPRRQPGDALQRPPGGYLEPALPRPQPAVAAFQPIDPDALAALLQDPRPGPQPARPDRQRPLQRRPDPGRRRPVAEPQPAKGRWRHPVRLHRAERPDLPLRKQRHAVRRLQRPRRALVEDPVPGQPGLPRRPGLAVRRRLRPWPGRPDPGRPGQRGLRLPLQPQWQERPALGTRPVAALRLPRRPGQGPQRDPALGHPPPRRRLHRPGNTRGNSSSDEYRVVVDYPIRLL